MESSNFLYLLADYSLTLVHTALLGFVMSGWIFPKTRRAHLLLLGLILISWIGLGYWYGFGYCVLTDVHWSIKQHLGQTDLPPSFIAYILEIMTGYKFGPQFVDPLSYVLLLLSIVMSILLNIRGLRRKA